MFDKDNLPSQAADISFPCCGECGSNSISQIALCRPWYSLDQRYDVLLDEYFCHICIKNVVVS
jgi:hypothetical protein